MDKINKLQFNSLTKRIADSIQTAMVSFDSNFKIIDYTPPAEKFFTLTDSVIQTLRLGTDPNIWNDWHGLIRSALQSGRKADFGTVKYSQNNQVRLLNISCVPIEDPSSQKLFGGALILHDITDKLDTEFELAQAERLIAIGKIAGKVAHELNNPLDGILRYVNLSLRILEKEPNEKAIEYLTHCRSGLQRMVQIISEMLEFSRSTHLAFEASPVDKLLEDAQRAMEIRLRNIEVRLVRTSRESLPHVKSDSLFQVFCNLIKNAADAMDGRGTLTITICKTETDWQIEFRDTGPGFSPEHAEDLFKPFFTTKAPSQGTGLGLAICKDILEKLNGTITAQNAPQGGGIFTVHLPHTTPQTPKPPHRSQNV